jgi:hypothetical protein
LKKRPESKEGIEKGDRHLLPSARQRRTLENQRRATMTSPIDGVVLERAVTNEQYLAAGTRVAGESRR